MKVYDLDPQFTERNFQKLISQLNPFFRSIGLENMKGDILTDVVIPANTSAVLPHRLKAIPKYRIILRQINGGTIIDGDDAWTDTSISLKNTGATDTILTVFVIRD